MNIITINANKMSSSEDESLSVSEESEAAAGQKMQLEQKTNEPMEISINQVKPAIVPEV